MPTPPALNLTSEEIRNFVHTAIFDALIYFENVSTGTMESGASAASQEALKIAKDMK